jgi:TonB family protein
VNARLLLLTGTLAAAVAIAACVPAPPARDTRVHQRNVVGLDPILETCVDAQGTVQSVNIVRSSRNAELDDAALKVARASRYSPGTEAGKSLAASCIKFKVRFVIKDGVPVPAGPPPAS